MTKFNYFRCDECSKMLENVECSTIQLMYTLIANYDTDVGYKAHFCGKACLQKYIAEKVQEHGDLPLVTDGERFKERETLGMKYEQKE